MRISNQSLYNELLSLNLDEKKHEFMFSDRLSRENKWSAQYCIRSINEYKRFIYLISISNKSLTPSDQVDQVWHLHLTYTKSYWVNMCRNILKYELHHGPTEGGSKELQKYKDQYKYTIELYAKEFGEYPPNDIWPGVNKRFKNADKFIRINSTNYWMIKKPVSIILPILFTPLIAIASTEENTDTDFWFYIKLVFGIYIAYKVIQWIYRNSGGKGNGGGCGSGCSGCGGCGG